MAFTVTGVADATVVKEGTLSLDVRGAGNAVCIVAPANLRDEEACAGLDLPATSAAETTAPGVTVRAHGVFRSRRPPRRTLGFLQVMEAESAEVWADEKSAAAFSSFFLNDLSKDLPANAKARVSAPRIETSHATRVVRFVLDVDGLAPGSTLQTTIEHQEICVVFGRNLTHIISFGGQRSDEETLRAIADEAIPTLDLEQEARPRPNTSGRRTALAIFLAVDVVIFALILRWRQRAKRRV